MVPLIDGFYGFYGFYGCMDSMDLCIYRGMDLWMDGLMNYGFMDLLIYGSTDSRDSLDIWILWLLWNLRLLWILLIL
jgi:hypothetical protein